MKRGNDAGLGDEELRQLQEDLILDPTLGDVIPNSGGARKIRVSLRGRGKRGGARVIYVDIVVDRCIYLLMVYPKKELSTLTADHLKKMRKTIAEIKKGTKR